jgi:hypothetical protein
MFIFNFLKSKVLSDLSTHTQILGRRKLVKIS